MNRFELVMYDSDVNHIRTDITKPMTEAAARAKAGRLSVKNNGPVDIASIGVLTIGGDLWDTRYITTAMPSEFHSTGYRFERLVD